MKRMIAYISTEIEKDILIDLQSKGEIEFPLQILPTRELLHLKLPLTQNGFIVTPELFLGENTYSDRQPFKPHSVFSDIDLFFESLRDYELIFYDQIQRIDLVDKSFSYLRELWQQLTLSMRLWLESENIDLVYFTNAPHELMSWPLYAVAKYLNIPTFFFQDNHNLGLKYFVSDIYGEWKSLVSEIEYATPALNEWKLSKTSEKSPIRPKYTSIYKDRYENAKSRKNQTGIHRKHLLRIRHLFQVFSNALNFSVSESGPTSLQEAKTKRLFFTFKYLLHYWESYMNSKCVQYEYSRLATNIDIEEDSIVFFLSYLPEMAVNPLSEPFLQHKLALSKLLACVPEKQTIYLKEHPSQVYGAGGYQYLGRFPGFYSELNYEDRVRFLSHELDSISLLEKCGTVVTLSGTVGWQALQLGKKVIVFGRTWYSSFLGVIKGSTLTEAAYSNPMEYDGNMLARFVEDEFRNGLSFAYSKDEAELIDFPWDPFYTKYILEKCITYAISTTHL